MANRRPNQRQDHRRINEPLYGFIRELIARLNVTQMEFARLVDVDIRTVQRWLFAPGQWPRLRNQRRLQALAEKVSFRNLPRQTDIY